MNDAATLILILVAAVLLRRSLLSSPDAAPGIRADWEDERGDVSRAAIPVPTHRPAKLPRTGTRRR
jgi:hypothetical protein